jgi:hypothetical protein
VIEYAHRYFHHPFPVDELAQLGATGWEMVGISNNDALGNAWFYFKRVRVRDDTAVVPPKEEGGDLVGRKRQRKT